MRIKAYEKVLSVLAVFSAVGGWVLLSNLPRYSEGSSIYRDSGVNYASWEPWTGIILFAAGISYFVVRFLKPAPVD